MSLHGMYLVVIAGLVLVVWIVAQPTPGAHPEFTAGYYCTGTPDGVPVYAPGRTVEGRAVVIWADSGRLHHIEIYQLVECQQSNRRDTSTE